MLLLARPANVLCTELALAASEQQAIVVRESATSRELISADLAQRPNNG